jgi:hypothetical protein
MSRTLNTGTRLLSKLLSRTNAASPAGAPRIPLSVLNHYRTWIAENRVTGSTRTRKYLRDWTRLTETAAAATASLAFAVYPVEWPKVGSRDDHGPIPNDWIRPNGRNPNILIHSMLVGIANHLLAVDALLERGLHNPARVVLRALNELCQTTLVVASRQDKMIAYSDSTPPHEARKAWQQHFTPRKLNETLHEIEQELDGRRRKIGLMRDRHRMHEYYSQSTHHASLVTFLLGYAQDYRCSGILRYALFGYNSPAMSANVLDAAHGATLEVVLRLPRIFTTIHKFEIPATYEWTEARTLGLCYGRYWFWLHKRLGHSEARRKPKRGRKADPGRQLRDS